MKRNKAEGQAARTALGWILDIGSKLIQMIVANLKERGVNIGEAFSRLASAEGESELRDIADQIAGMIAGAGKKILRLLTAEPLIINTTDGSEVLADATDVFTGYVDPDFRNWKADEQGPPTEKTPAQVYEMAEDATFAQMFGSLSSDVAKLCFTQAQIKAFVKQYRDWLRTDVYATFFLFRAHGHFFVASVFFDDGGRLGVNVAHFERGRVWDARYRRRMVVPQLA